MISSRGWKVWSTLALVGALAGMAGCYGGTTKDAESAEGTAQAVSQETEVVGDDALDEPAGHHARRSPGRGGPAHLLMTALHELDLTDTQKATIKSAFEKVHAGMRAHGPADRAPFAALADGVRAGKIDPNTVLPSVGDKPEAHRAAIAEALQTLHTTLTKEQRRALVDTIAARTAEHGSKGMHRGMKGARKHGRDGARFKGPLAHMLDELNVTDEQRTAIDRALEANKPADIDREAMKQRFEARRAEMRTRLESFASDTFDAKAFVTPAEGDKAGGPRQHLERMVKTLAVVVPILDPAQRETLAARIENGPPAHMRPGKHRGGHERGSRHAPVQ